MAQTVFRHRPSRIRPGHTVADVTHRAHRAWSRLHDAFRLHPRLFLWHVLWLPFWTGSEVPTPALPSSRSATRGTLPHDPAGSYLTARIDRITRLFGFAWLAGSLFRGVTLALLALSAWVLVAVLGFAGLPGWVHVVGLVGAGLAAGAWYGWMARPDRLMVARMFDRTFGLRERIVTAFDRPADPGRVSQIQLADAANTFDEIVAEVPRSSFLPVREAAICLIMAGALVTLLLAYVPRQPVAAVAESPVPQFVPASERLAARDAVPPPPPLTERPEAEPATIAEIQERGRQSQSAREDLARLGDALRDHPLTQPAAESIASGEYAAAADSLRSVSESASAMPQESREALAEDLDEAAQEMSGANPELAQAANEAASALREGGPEAASAVNELAGQVEATGSEVESQEDLARDLDEAQSGSSDPSSSSNEGSQGEPSGSNQSQSPSQQGEGEGQAPSDPGEGSSAQPGVANQPQESSESSSSSGSSEGSSEEGSGSAPASDGAGEQPSQSQQGEGSGEPSSAAPGSEGEGSASSQAGMQGAPDDETSASQGSGAGTGQRGANDQNSSDESVDSPSDPAVEDPNAEVPGAGEAGEPPPSRADRGEEDDGTGAASQGSSSLELQGASDSGVQTGGDSGSSSLGSGTGSTTASGDEAGGSVGVAGPDSNRVPDALRDVVKDFFGGPEE